MFTRACKDRNRCACSIDEILARWRQLTGDLPDVIALKFTDQERGIAGRAIDLRVQGQDLDTLKQVSKRIQGFLGTIEGVTDVSDDLRHGKPQVNIGLKDSAGIFGLTARAVADELRNALYGNTGMEILRNGETYDVKVRLSDADRNGLNDLRQLRVRGPNDMVRGACLRKTGHAVAAFHGSKARAQFLVVRRRISVTSQVKQIVNRRMNGQESLSLT